MRYSNRPGSLIATGGVSTDDRGLFRVFDLIPGDYLISAVYNSDELRLEQMADAQQAALDEALAAAKGNLGVMTTSSGQTFTAVTAPAPSELPDQSSTYAPTYYPGTTTPAAGSIITVGAGEERAGIDFQIQRVIASSIRGVVVGGPATGPFSAIVSLSVTGDEIANIGVSSSARTRPDGAFVLQAVPPGQYILTVRTLNAPSPPPAPSRPGAPPAAPPKPPEALWGRMPIVADGTPLTGIAIPLQPGLKVSGRVVFDGAKTPPDLASGHVRMSAMLTLAPGADRLPGIPMRPARLDEKGEFTIDNVVPGQYLLRVSGASGWYPRSAVVNGRDTLDIPLEITGDRDVENALVTMTDRTTELAGTITDGSGAPLSALTIVIFPEDQQYLDAAVAAGADRAAGHRRHVQVPQPAAGRLPAGRRHRRRAGRGFRPELPADARGRGDANHAARRRHTDAEPDRGTVTPPRSGRPSGRQARAAA